MKYTKAFTDNAGSYVFQTRERGGLDYGVLASATAVGPEQPLGTIERFMPYSQWTPVEAADVPPAIRQLVEDAPEPAAGGDQ